MNLLHQILARMLFVKQFNLNPVHLIMKLHIPLVLMKTLSGSLSLLLLPMGALLPYLALLLLPLQVLTMLKMIVSLLTFCPLFVPRHHILVLMLILISTGLFRSRLIKVIRQLRLLRRRFLWPLALNLVKATRKVFFVSMENIRVVLLLNSSLDALLHMLTLSVIQPFFTLLIVVFLFISTLLEEDGLRRSGVV